MKNSSYYIAPAGDRTHDNMIKVSYALTTRPRRRKSVLFSDCETVDSI